MCLKARGDRLRSILRVLVTLWEMPKEYWRSFQQRQIHFGKCPNRSGDPLGAFPSVSPANRKQGYPLGQLPSMSPYTSGLVLLISKKNGGFIKLN